MKKYVTLLQNKRKSFFARFFSHTQLIVLSFLIIILIGSGLLCLPIASTKEPMKFVDALFTACSATCVTGLSVNNVALDFTLFGQIVTLILIQIGGLGFMTITSATLALFGKHMTLKQRLNMSEDLSQNNMSGVGRIFLLIIRFTFIIEGVGAILLAIGYSQYFSIGKSIYYGIFHSISAFCNAGFDCIDSPLGSMTMFKDNAFILLVLACLIVLGGIGFLTMVDVFQSKRFKKYRVDTKIILITTGILISVGTIIYLIVEYNNPQSFGDMNFFNKLVNALFASVTTRTAGFCAIQPSSFKNVSVDLTMLLMFIGASPGSCGGGLKTTTAFILFIWIVSCIRQKDSIIFDMHQIGHKTLSKATTFLVIALSLIITSHFLITITDGDTCTPVELLFELISAYATVGLSLGITAKLSVLGKLIVIMNMFLGRVGIYTFFVALAKKQRKAKKIIYPEINIAM